MDIVYLSHVHWKEVSLYLGWVIWKVADYVLDLLLVYDNYCHYLDANYMIVYANYWLSI